MGEPQRPVFKTPIIIKGGIIRNMHVASACICTCLAFGRMIPSTDPVKIMIKIANARTATTC